MWLGGMSYLACHPMDWGLLMVATFPYTTSDKVATLLAANPIWEGGFTAQTKPSKSVVDYFLNLVAASVDMHLSSAGYIIPLRELPGEPWLESQTHFLDYLVCVGTAGMIGNTLRPAPAMGPGTESSPGNVFYQQYQSWLRAIEEGRMGFRAAYRIGTPAERFNLSPLGPRWTFGDPTFTDMVDVVGFWASAIEEEGILSTLQLVANVYRGVL